MIEEKRSENWEEQEAIDRFYQPISSIKIIKDKPNG